jgi:hypothetical protein
MVDGHCLYYFETFTEGKGSPPELHSIVNQMSELQRERWSSQDVAATFWSPLLNR